MGGFIMLSRRTFIKKTIWSSAGLFALPVMAAPSGFEKLMIMHTNDLHCHFEPFPDNDPKFAGRGGMNRISAYVKKMRQYEPDLLLFDSGDFSQGTPYYNLFKGEVVLKLMSEMGYNASTIGNHEFDSGLESLKNAMEFANFPIVSSNYDFSKTPFAGMAKKHLVLERKGIRIGVYALGIELQGLVGKSLAGNTEYLNPVEVALETEEYLKNNQQCDMIICLSHLGFKYDLPKVDDIILAQSTYFTDLILGGHTHTFLEAPYEAINKSKQSVVINQVGWAALMLGQLEFYFEKQKKTHIDLKNNKRI
ncbi:MAG TPA: metallophosphatase [Prolixibacteraceae bacterium]|nr:metallophosphatase [Prolixibacteraceae bacterium]